MTEEEISRKTRILIVEDDAIISRHLQACLLKVGYQVVGTASSGNEAIKITEQVDPELVLIDLSLRGELDGIETASAIHAWHDVPILFLVASADEQTLQRTRAAHPSGYVLQPFDRRSLFTSIEMALDRHRLAERAHDGESMVRTLIDNTGEAVVITDLEDRITFVNSAAQALFDLPASDLVGNSLSKFATHRSNNLSHATAGRSHSASTNTIEFQLTNLKGHTRRISATALNRVNVHGDSSGTFFILREIAGEGLKKNVALASDPPGDTLQEIGSLLGTTLDVSEVLERILGHAGRIVPHHSARILVIEGDELHVVQEKANRSGLDEAISTLHPINWKKDPFFLHIYLVGEPACIQDGISIHEMSDYPQMLWSTSNICAPLKTDRRTIGFILLGHSAQHFYGTQHMERLSAFAGQAASALENARLYDQTHQRAQYLSLLNEIAQTSIDSSNLNDTMGIISQKMVRLFNADGAVITLWDDQRQSCVLAASTGNYQESGKSLPVDSFELAVTRSILSTGKTLVVEDTVHSPSFRQEPPPAFPFKTVICFPLISDGQKLGAVIIGYAELHTFTHQEIDRGEQATRQVAMAIAKARFFAEIQRLAITDALTNLLNRRGIFELAQKEVDLAHKLNLPLSMLWLDIDNFKSINDLHGHHIGDEVVREVATRVRATLRERDLVGRYGGEGGDEFIVLLPETDANGARQVAERLRGLISRSPVNTEKSTLQITVSVGLTALKDEHDTLSTLLKRADEAMYAAKSAGRDCVIAQV